MGDNAVHAMQGVSLEVWPGEFVAVMGPSGSGKSTFMNVVGCLDQPTSGSYELNGVDVATLTRDELADARNREIGFIFQSFNLLPRMTALGNVMLPMLYSGVPERARQQRAMAALKAVGLQDREHHKPKEMSGGQQQRTAVARALVNKPSVILADEPTGALDSRTSLEIIALLQHLNKRGATIVIVTHEEEVAAHCSRIVRFSDGRVRDDQPLVNPVSAQEQLNELEASREDSAA